MNILIVGGAGHIGSYLTPRLTAAGHKVRVVARHAKPHYGNPQLGWQDVEWIIADRKKEEKDPSWLNRMTDIETDIVIDLICYQPEQNRIMMQAFAGRIEHFLHCGSIWAYGPAIRTPFQESYPRNPISTYGRNKAYIEAELIDAFQKDGFPATIVHPGHISGREWLPIDPQGTVDGVGIYKKLAHEQTVHLPNTGLATLHHVHADDVAQMFERSVLRRQAALGEAFSTVAPYALTLLGCCECVATLFGKKPNIEFVPLAQLQEILGEKPFATTKTHVEHSPCAAIDKAKRLLGYQPRYTTEQIYHECLAYLLETGELTI